MNSHFGLSTIVICSLSLLGSLLAAGWTELNSGTTADLYAVHFPEGTHVGYAVGDSGAILKTTDRGDTWVLQTSGTMSGLNSVYFKDNDTGYAVGDLGAAVRTTDGGVTWTAMTLHGPDQLTRVQFPENTMTGYIGVHPDSGALVLKSTDGGDNWVCSSVGGPLDRSYSCGFANDSIGVIVGDDGLVLGIDGYQDAQTNADLVAVAFAPDDPNKGYLIGNDSTHGVVRYTDDGGWTLWDSVTCMPVPGAVYGVDLATTGVAYVCGSEGFLARALRPTLIVQTQYDGDADLHGVCFPAGTDTGFAVGTGGVILRTYDGGNPMSVAEATTPATCRRGIRVVSNPSRRGVAFHADACVDVVVFDAAGRVVVRQAAARGLNFLPLPKAGVYFVHEAQGQAQAQAVHKVIISE
jgi:photosystem II stability/assembly factor-like uncharacterized protein